MWWTCQLCSLVHVLDLTNSSFLQSRPCEETTSFIALSTFTDLMSSSSLYSRPFYKLYFLSLWDKFMLCGFEQWSRPLLWISLYLDLVLAHSRDFNNASSSWDESVHLMDLESSAFCGLKVVHFKDLKTCPWVRPPHGLRVVYFLWT